jgi:hypothetical protein
MSVRPWQQILAILENQNVGKLQDCAQYQAGPDCLLIVH